jgi:hypothetical protein
VLNAVPGPARKRAVEHLRSTLPRGRIVVAGEDARLWPSNRSMELDQVPIGMSRLVRAELLGSHADLDLRSASGLERQLDELCYLPP